MSIHCVCGNPSFMRILSHIQRIKWTSTPYNFFLYNSKVQQNFSELPISRIIYTDSNVRSHRYEVQELEKEESLFIEDSFLKENFNIVDSRYFKLITVPNECSHIEELLRTNEFKDVLSRSFVYDINLSGNNLHMLSETVDLHPQSCENVIYTYENFLMNKQSAYRCDKLSSSDSKVKDYNEGKPSEEQLLRLTDRLTYTLINFFKKPHDFSIYHKNIVFQNNIKGVTIRGLKAYIQTMYVIKFYGYLHFTKVQVEILKVTHHIEDGSIRVRWRVNGLPRHKLLLLLLKYKSVNWKELPETDTQWLDGFSVFSVGGDGLIKKHVCDKMIPDDDHVLSKKNDFRSKILGLLGLAPRNPSASTLSNLLPCCKSQDLAYKKLT